MRRREAIAALLAAGTAQGATSLEECMAGAAGCALLVDVAATRLIAAYRPDLAGAECNPPGSTVKPLVLAALLRAGKLSAEEGYACPGHLVLAGDPFPCAHPRVAAPIRVRTALAYSCNCFVAHFAERFASGELAGWLERAGLASRTGWMGAGETEGSVQPAAAGLQTQLQALGERRVAVTAAGLALAFRRLAVDAPAAVRQGLEDAVEYGTGQRALVEGLKVAGKTGSLRSDSGKQLAWFSGFAPSDSPRVVVTVMLQGRSGGSDAAPVASRILAAWRAGRL